MFSNAEKARAEHEAAMKTLLFLLAILTCSESFIKLFSCSTIILITHEKVYKQCIFHFPIFLLPFPFRSPFVFYFSGSRTCQKLQFRRVVLFIEGVMTENRVDRPINENFFFFSLNVQGQEPLSTSGFYIFRKYLKGTNPFNKYVL